MPGGGSKTSEFMRYTTIIDITEAPMIYRSESVRLVYLHLCLTCGYHDNDKGLIRHSLRRMASDVGVTLSALRHALRVLGKYDLVRRHRGKLYVRNFVGEQAITTPRKRAKKAQEAQEQEAARAERERLAQQQEVLRSERDDAVTREEWEQMKKERTKNLQA